MLRNRLIFNFMSRNWSELSKIIEIPFIPAFLGAEIAIN